MPHDMSIITQRELGTDIMTMEDGIRQGTIILPDIMHVSGIESREEFLSLTRAASAEILTILSYNAMDEKFLLSEIRSIMDNNHAKSFEHMLRAVIVVTPSIQQGRLNAEVYTMMNIGGNNNPYAKRTLRQSILK